MFMRHNVCSRTFKTKTKLKGKIMGITESLTKKRVIELTVHMMVKILFLDINDRNNVFSD